MHNDIQGLLRDVSELILAELPNLEKRRYDIRWKSDGSPVTAGDIYLEETICTFLKDRIDNLTFIGEESWSERLDTQGDWKAVLDPIDGTENFCSGLKEWGVSLSIWQGNQHAGSMLMMPELGELMTSGNIPRVPRSRIVGLSSSYNEDIGLHLKENEESRIMGCAVYNLFNVIRGSYCRFINPKGARSWDLLAGAALAHEAGCNVMINNEAYDGRFLEPNQRYRIDIQHRYDLHSG